MQKKINIIFIVLISFIILPLSVNAGEVVTVDVKNDGGKLTVSGTAESDVHAVAVLVYSNSELVYMESCASDEEYSCELEKEFDKGTYLIKVANYDGGDYRTKEINIKNNSAKTEANPKTSDTVILSVIIGSISLIGALGCAIYLKKRKKLN